MSALKEAAARAAGTADDTTTPGPVDETAAGPGRPRIESEPLPDIEYTNPVTEADQVPVYVAFARVMADVQSIDKGDNRSDSGGKYKFRGVDRVVNAVGPALRRHGLLVVPVRVYDVEYRDLKTKSGGSMQEVTLKVQWLVVGPTGDRLPELLESVGQANDTADKGTAKAMSVAQRVLFLTGLHVPTNDPTIDAGHDRGERPRPQPGPYRDEALEPGTSKGRLRQIYQEVVRHGLGPVLVVNEHGDEEQLGKLVSRVGQERRAADEAPPPPPRPEHDDEAWMAGPGNGGE